MITNQLMKRQLGDFEVTQRTKDGMFNATELLKQWNNYVETTENLNTPKKGELKKKDLDHYFRNDSTKEFIAAIEKEEELKGDNPTYLTVRGKHSGGTWMHPLLFIDFAMWLNPAFKVKVIKFVYDKMLEYRNESGEAYKELSAAVQKIVNDSEMRSSMKKIAEALNWIVFGSHETQMRNKHGEEALQKELFELERKLAMLVNEGFINTYEGLLNYLRYQWKLKNTPPCFITDEHRGN